MKIIGQSIFEVLDVHCQITLLKLVPTLLLPVVQTGLAGQAWAPEALAGSSPESWALFGLWGNHEQPTPYVDT